jgi:hypothetical protein
MRDRGLKNCNPVSARYEHTLPEQLSETRMKFPQALLEDISSNSTPQLLALPNKKAINTPKDT